MDHTGVLSEVVDRRDGSMARTPYLLEFARMHAIKCITIADLVHYLQGHAHVQQQQPPIVNGVDHHSSNGRLTSMPLTEFALQ